MVKEVLIDEKIRTQLVNYLNEKHVVEMKRFIAHGSVNVYEHSLNVAKMAYRIGSKYSSINMRCLLIGAMLHDLYLYDWHNASIKVKPSKLHGFIHSTIAKNNAIKYFDVDDKTQNIIESHMWPLTLRKIPKSKEAWIVCFADKLVAVKETLRR